MGRNLVGPPDHSFAQMDQPILMAGGHRVGEFPQFDRERMQIFSGGTFRHSGFPQRMQAENVLARVLIPGLRRTQTRVIHRPVAEVRFPYSKTALRRETTVKSVEDDLLFFVHRAVSFVPVLAMAAAAMAVAPPAGADCNTVTGSTLCASGTVTGSSGAPTSIPAYNPSPG